MKINLTYKANPKSIPSYCYDVFDAYGLSSKNIKNSVLFIVKNILNSYVYNQELKTYQLKDNLHSNQTNIIKIVNETIVNLNAKLKTKYEVNLKLYNEEIVNIKINENRENIKDKDKPKEPKLVQFNVYEKVIDSKTYYQIINKSLLENVIKHKEIITTEFKDYTIIHSHLAQSVVQQVCDEYSYYFKALKEYFKIKSNKINNNFTGKPKEPGYKAKNSRISFEISTQRFNADGTVLLVGKNHQLYKDYDKKEILDKSVIEQFNSFNLMELIVNDLKTKNINYLQNIKDYAIASIRIIPGKYKKKPKLEYVVSFAKELQGFYPELITKSKQQYNKDFFDLKSNVQLAVMKDYFNNDFKSNDINNLTNKKIDTNTKLNNNINNIPYFMGIDLGVVNFAAVSFFTKNKDINYVISGKNLKTRITKLDIKIDKKKQELCIEVIKHIQSKKDKQEQLTRQELRLLNEYYKSIGQNDKISKYQENKNNISNDFIHKMSKCLIDDCVAKDIKVIVVGKNKGWKQEINHGSKNNRTMYNFPHAKFIEILKYKGLLKDIVVIETEESYTSKTSFIDNEELGVFGKCKDKNVDWVNSENNLTQGNKNQLSKKLNGKRVDRKFKSNYKSKDKTKSRIIHADINGSFNIVRKVLKNFVYDKELITLEYKLMELKLNGKKKLFNFNQKKKIEINSELKNKELIEICG